MEIIKLRENMVDDFKSFLCNKILNIDEDDYCGIRYQYILDCIEKGERNYLIFVKEDKIFSFAVTYDIFKSINVISVTDENEEIFSLIRKYYPSSILEGDYCSNYKKFGYFRCRFNSTIDSEKEYDCSGNFFVSDKKNIYILRDCFEKMYFPELGEISYEVLSGEQICSYFASFEQDIFRVPTWSAAHCNIAGFHYFTPMDYSNSKMNYLVAKTGGIIIGIIKFGPSAMLKRNFVLSFIDVSEKYRNKGIATALFRELGKYIGDEVLYVTKESEMGRKCHMLDICKKYISNVEELPY